MCLVLLLCLSAAKCFAYTNFLSPSDQAIRGIGDPFVMKYNGVYYLYPSDGGSVGFQVWSSTDLVNWTYGGLVATDDNAKAGYAPEVKYSNGTFYLYTSPHGAGHYVYTSSSPLGPFTPATGNQGHDIDGSVFVDDNGTWYFLSASGSGIQGSVMTNPLTLGTRSVIPGGQMNGQWTEGPGIFKRNGVYYMTFTGNHVLSTGYRVDVATNTTGPLSTYTQYANPILLNTEGTGTALGHSSNVIGPDLDTYYTVYHNLMPGIVRRLNIDAMGFNGSKLVVYGPTTWAMPTPAAPAWEDRFQRAAIGTGYSNLNGGAWGIAGNFLTQSTKGSQAFFIEYENQVQTASDYTAEFNVQETSRGVLGPKCGAVYGYVNGSNYGVAILRGTTKQLETELLVGGVWSTQVLTALPASFDSLKLHNIRVEKSGTTYKYYVDGSLIETKTGAGLGAGYIGYLACDDAAQFGYMAFSNKVNGSGIFDYSKPIPGSIEAVHYNTGGEGVGYHDNTAGNLQGKYIRNDNVDIRDNPEGGCNIGSNTTGEWYKYNVSTKSTGVYNVGIRYATTYATSQVRIWYDSTDVTGVVTLPLTGGWDNWQTYTIKGLNLTAGNHTIRVETVTGEFDFSALKFYAADNSAISFLDNFATAFSGSWNYTDGTWAIESGEASINNTGKRTLGNTGWSDYTVECDIKGMGPNVLNSGIMVRVQNPANGGAGDNPTLGSDFSQAYMVGLGPTAVFLGKENYNWVQLAATAGTYGVGTWYHMKVVVSGNNIKVYVVDMVTPKINYTDNNNPFINGKVGLRAYNSYTHFDNFSVVH